MKKFLILLCIIAVTFLGAGCNESKGESQKIQIVATLFPYYDFAKTVAGDKADVVLLLPTGAEAHSYEPTAQDIVKMRSCDIFINSGMGADPWADNIVNDSGFDREKVVSALEHSALISDKDMHMHNSVYSYDEHVWTSLKNVQKIVNAISEKLSQKDPENSAYYSQNAANYSKKLDELDKKFQSLSENDIVIVLADRFPFKYFVNDYGIKYFAAYPGCSSESEPSAATVAQMIDMINKEGIDTVFYTETSNGQLPDAVCEETGTDKALLHSCHTVSKEQMKEGITYLDLMQKNYEAIKNSI